MTADFEALFLEHWPHVYGVLLRVTGDPAEAEDLALEAFLRLHQQLQRDPGRLAHPGGWLYRTATHLGLNALRASQRRAHYEQTAGREALLTAPSEDPALAYQRAEEQRRVRAVLRSLPERQAQLLLLRHSGLSYQEIAHALELAPGSVGTLLARAEQEFEKAYRAGEKEG